ncbi:hypothetical protein J5N97_027748 [Dioscorea zingiberensis]|uniref:Cytochrome P450 n=1 Tax=Dioscorea zingiberensis TaxID=325984 RepID=A0A9D5H496_9LILI|nr:hypothetical protein J5N97_027748 [Dioscorea zingiberensis]
MEEILVSLVVVCACVAIGVLGVVSYWAWWKPKMLEMQLRRQGLQGNKYRLLTGNIKDEQEALKKAWSRPMELAHKIVPRMVRWAGTSPRVNIWDPDMLREVMLNKSGHFLKQKVNPLVRLLAHGIASLEGEAWAQRRKLINPAFHTKKLKGMVPAFQTSCTDLVKRWKKLMSAEGSCELDVWSELQNLTADVISRTAFGSSFEEGKKIFELQKEQGVLVIEAARSLYVPGFRYISLSVCNDDLMKFTMV